jgi:hypothetical protein
MESKKQSGTTIKESTRKQDLMAWTEIWGAGGEAKL